MPPDRVFGRLEKQLRNIETMVTPSDYHSVYRDMCSVNVYGQDWEVVDVKDVVKSAFKVKLPFLMRDQKVFIYKKGKNTISVKSTYSGGKTEHSILKIGSSLSKLGHLQVVNKSNHVSIEKRNDVKKLLEYVVMTPEAQAFYDDVFQTEEGITPGEAEVYGTIDESDTESYL